MTKQIVIAECVDARTGARYFPGETFPDPEPAQAERLTAAGCLAPEGSDAAKAALAKLDARRAAAAAKAKPKGAAAAEKAAAEKGAK